MISRLLLVCAIVLAGSYAVADEDPIRDRLEKAVATYEAQRVKYTAAVEKHLESRETVARRKGDKTVIDQVAAERAAIANARKPPAGLPKNIGAQFGTARRLLETAYAAAIRDYTKASEDQKATDVQYQLEDFQLEDGVNLLEGTALSQWCPAQS